MQVKTIILCTFPADPGLLFIVTQGTIRYVHLTESTLAEAFSNFENIQFLLDVGEARISGICTMNSHTQKRTFIIIIW